VIPDLHPALENYASVWPRIVAVCIDVCGVNMVVLGTAWVGLNMGYFPLLNVSPHEVVLTRWMAACGGSLLLLLGLYGVAMEVTPWQGTVGKRLMGLRVAGRDGQRLSFRRTLARNGLKVLLLLFSGCLACTIYMGLMLLLSILRDAHVLPAYGLSYVDQSGFHFSFWGIIRTLLLLFLVVSVSMAGGFCCFWLAAFTRRKQALHDLLAGSLVLHHLHHDAVPEYLVRRRLRLASQLPLSDLPPAPHS
jgi:uncharacterized RDD family membrane protein YckC